MLRASQDGYAELFNVVHHRTLALSSDGQRLDGEDVFTPAKGEDTAGRVATSSRSGSICIPPIKANRLADGHSAMLLMPNKDMWTFSAYEDRIEIEESVYLAGPDGPRRRCRSSSTAAPAR